MIADIEHAVICNTILGGDLKPLTDVRLTQKFFLNLSHRNVFVLILDHFREYGQVPDAASVQQAYPQYEVTQYPEPLAYYVAQLQDAHMLRTAVSGIEEKVRPVLQEDGPDRGQKLLEALHEVAMEARHEVPLGRDEDLFGTAREYLLPEIELRKTIGFLRGISTGFDTIDRVTGGAQPEQLITLAGLPKAGKSSVMLQMAITARKQGYRLLFVTFEMSNEEQRDRAAALVSGIDLNKILSGNINSTEMKHLDLTLRRMEVLEGFTLVHDRSSMMNLSGVAQKIVEYKPDVVFIDGVYLMDDELNAEPGSPRALTNITRGLKRIAQAHRLPIIGSTQALSHKAKKGINADSIGYTSSFLQDSDVVFGVESKTETISVFKVMASRSGPKKDTYLRFDWTRGVVEEIDPTVADAEINQANATGDGGGEDGW